jgi:Thiol-disulfide isomerase and thioredoxins
MKIFTWIVGLILCTVCTVQAKDRVIERPPFLAWSSNSIEIDKIVMSDTATTLYVKAFYRPKYWIKIATGSFLKDNNGTLYPIRKGIGITLEKEFWMPESGEAEFQLLFPPIPKDVTSLDFSEGDFDGAYKIWGIQLNEKGFRKSPLPEDAINNKINKKAQLPVPELIYGKTILTGKVLDFKKDMPASGRLQLNDPVRWLDFSEEVTINEDGTFQVQTDVITVTPAILVFPFAQIPCLLAPGKESSVIINTAECTRQQSHLRKDDKPYGKKAYYSGYLAELQQELADNAIPTNLVNSPKKIVDEVIGKDLNGIKGYFMEKRNDIRKQIEKTSLSPAAKEILKANTDITTAIGLLMGKDILKRAHVVGQKMNQEQAKEYYMNTRIEFPDNYFNVLKELALNTPADLYAPEYAYGTGIFSSQKELIEQYLGTNQGILFQMIEAHRCYRSIEGFTPLTAQEIAKLESLPSPAYKDMLTELNKKLLKKIELNKQKTGYKINEIGEAGNEELFSAIISRFKGHVLLVDFWATWCGPCRTANKAMIPLKEELKDKDILYLYVAGENSPKETWKNMIPDIHGEHFRLTSHQWKYLTDKFNIQGVPTYFIIDRKGNTVYQQTGFPGADTMKKKLTEALDK